MKQLTKVFFVLVLTSFFPCTSFAGAEEPAAGKISPGYVDYDVYMLGADNQEKIDAIRSSIRRTPTVALVSYSGMHPEMHKGQSIEYVGGGAPNGMHDDYQISEVFQIADRFGFKVNIKIFLIKNSLQAAEAFRKAGKCADIVITYFSYWTNARMMLGAVAQNPETLYISPYVEIGQCPPTDTSFQGGGRHPDGSGIRNLITTLPLARSSNGNLFTPSARNQRDTETVNFITPSSYASNMGETCPSAGVALVAAAYIMASAEEEDIPVEQVISLMRDNVSFPAERMLATTYFNETSVKNLRDHLDKLTAPDAVGIRRLEADGVVDIWNIYQAMHAEKE